MDNRAIGFHTAGFWVSRTGDVMVLFSLVAALTFARHDLARRWRVAAIGIISSMVFLQVASGVLAVIAVVFMKMAVQQVGPRRFSVGDVYGCEFPRHSPDLP